MSFAQAGNTMREGSFEDAEVVTHNCCGYRPAPFKDRNDFLDHLYVRNREYWWPVSHVYVPIWEGANQLKGVSRVNEESCPYRAIREGMFSSCTAIIHAIVRR